MSYRGESPAKKIARRLHWQVVASLLREAAGGSLWGSGKAVFLSSAEAGDVPVLRDLGVLDDQIVGVDRSWDAVQEARRRFPSVRFEHGDVRDVLRRTRDARCVYLDLCISLSREAVRTFSDVVGLLPPNTIVGINIKRGRETDAEVKLALNRSTLVLPNSIRGQELDATRIDALLQLSMTRCIRAGRYPILANVINYQSRGLDSRGSPMTCATFVLAGQTMGESRSSFIEHGIERQREAIEFLRSWSIDLGAWDETQIRELVVGGGVSPESLAVSRGTASAWKAHDTRGTYRREKVAQ